MFPIRLGKWYAAATAACLALAPLPASRASPLRDPKRVVEGQVVDLTPLFHWWAKQDGDRPLKAWAHVTGAVVGTNAWGWIIDAHVERALPASGGDSDAPKQAKIILRHPPAAEFGEFETLAAQLKDLNDQHAKLSADAAQATKRSQDAASKQTANNVSVRRAARLQQEARQSNQTASEDEAQLKTLDQQIKEVKEKLVAFPSATKYSVDSFALDLKQQADGMPLFERGGVGR
jgi:hypothetical protein